MFEFFKVKVKKEDLGEQLCNLLVDTGKNLSPFKWPSDDNGEPFNLKDCPFSGFYLVEGWPYFLYKEPAWSIIIGYNTKLGEFWEIWPSKSFSETFTLKTGYIPEMIKEKVLAAFPEALKTFKANLQQEIDSELEKKYGTGLVL